MDEHHPVEESYLDEDRTLGQGQREHSRRDLDRPQIRSSNPNACLRAKHSKLKVHKKTKG